ncbi:pentaheme c-type cytochrome TorC [Aestuariirhabdus sp. Z084]|uniref:pentaheme c-type cytochrome TorC n=1 Tax=Aestuariirhabdus haliotis TaxID=2918751 RepID=UPI00201B361E|nr:pentaheme c-type cytochrome TorC [Aestuariirhabdus haliotis]MCL6417197.1 pentaheme c-type cytochrome TorC [Aestuariirhabdus haliotis]MCL6421169.1 pentaheme c-type cytochrome TorC [Aestuariirhabdus haliotis]
MLSRILSYWRVVSTPAKHISLGVLTLGGFLAGIIFWGGFNTALEATNTETFCISCHEMRDNVYQELQQTVHWSNPSGVRATCPDCHVPHNWTDKIARKMQASKEVWGTIFGTINTREKFLAKRLELASHEWKRLSANGSLECKNCHDYGSMKFEAMSKNAQARMHRAAENDQSCIDCHKGIAHQLPENMSAASGALAALQPISEGTNYESGAELYSIRKLPLYTDASLQQTAGQLNSASKVSVVKREGDSILVELAGWRKKKGFGRVINADFGRNIREATLTKTVSTDTKLVSGFEIKEDDLTGLPWQRISTQLWMKTEGLVSNKKVLWQEAGEIYVNNCSICHAQPDENHFNSNAWPGMFYGMISFVNLDDDTQDLVLKYLQNHSSDFDDSAH